MLELTLSPNSMPVLRTDYRDDAAWAHLLSILHRQEDPAEQDFFPGIMEPVEHPDLNSASLAKLVAGVLRPCIRRGTSSEVDVFVADQATFDNDELPLLAVAVRDPARIDGDEVLTFRVAARSAYIVEPNIVISNLLFEEFLDTLDPDGVFRMPQRHR